MAINKTSVQNGSDPIRYMLIGVLVVAAFFGAYKFASAASTRAASANGVAAATPAASAAQLAAQGGGSSAAAGGGGCCGGAGASAGGGCCGGGGAASTKPVAGTAKLSGGVQTIDVKVTTSYSPNVIKLKAGVPAEINFSSAQGCTGIVQSTDLNFQEDLTTGPKTVKLQGLQPGTYGFACGMNMVQGQIVVQ